GADEEMERDGLGHGPGGWQPELASAGAAVEDDHRPVGGPDLDAGRIPAIARRLRPGCGDRSTRAPEAQLHEGYSYHNARPEPPLSRPLRQPVLGRIRARSRTFPTSVRGARGPSSRCGPNIAKGRRR